MRTSLYSDANKAFYVIIGTTSILAALLVIYQTSTFGPGVSPDSVSYLAAAGNLTKGEGMISYYKPYIYWPPLFPLILSLSTFLGIQPYEFSRFINAFSLGGIIFFSGIVLSKIIKHRILLYLGLCALAISPRFMEVSIFIWSEPTFILFSSLCLLYLAFYVERGRKQALYIGAFFCSLAILTRYIGIVILPVGALIILVQPKTGWMAKLRDVCFFGLIGSLPTALWVMRNWLEYGTLTGERYPSMVSFVDAIASVALTVSGWLIPSHWPAGIHVLLLAILLSLFVYYAYLEIAFKESDSNKQAIIFLAPYALFFGTYVLFLCFSASRVAFGPIGNRLLSPVIVPFFIAVFFVIDRVVRSAEINHTALPARSLSAVFLGLWLIGYPARTLYWGVEARIQSGAGGYASSQWKNDELIKYLLENDHAGRIFSNAPDAIYFLTKKSAYMTPKKRPHPLTPAGEGDDIADLLQVKKSDEKVYIVWINRKKGRDYLYSLDEIDDIVEFKLVYKNSDGVVYEIVRPIPLDAI